MARNTTLVADLLKSLVLPVPVSSGAEFESASLDIDKTSGQFAIQVRTESGVAPSVKIIVEVSLDGVDYAEIASEVVTTEDNTAIFDFVNGSGASFLKVRTETTSGTLDITKILFKGKEER